MLRVAVIGGAIAIPAWLLAMAIDGLPAFIFNGVAVGLGAMTVALIVNQTIDRTADFRHRRRLIHRFSPTAMSDGVGIRRCDLCNRIEMQASHVWLCPHCDNPTLS